MIQAFNGFVLLILSTCLITIQAEEFIGRHVCNQQQTVTQSVPIQQTYRRAVYKNDKQSVTYQTAYRTVFRMQFRAELVPGCCPGWEKRSARDVSCLKPVCSEGCENKGQCVGPGLCVCAEGYTGYKCHIDIDECSGRNACQQKCSNLLGSYECSCQDGFLLSSDKHTCDLCLNCTKEFQDLQNQVQAIQVNKVNDRTLQEIRWQIDNLTIVKAEVDSINNIKKEIDFLKNTSLQDARYQKLNTKIESLQNKTKDIDLIKTISGKIDKIEKSSVQEARLIQLRRHTDSILKMKTQIESIKATIGEIKRLQQDDTQSRKITNLQGQMESFIVTKEEQDRKLAGRLEVMRIELEYVSEMKVQIEEMKIMRNQLREMENRIKELETDKVELKSSLTSAVTRYEAAINAQHQKNEVTHFQTTSDPDEMDERMPMDTLASLSQQISLLEEKMADCTCNQDYPRG